MNESEKLQEELEFERAKNQRLKRQSKERSTSYNLIFAGAIGLVIYGVSGFSFVGGLIGFVAFVGLGAYLNKSIQPPTARSQVPQCLTWYLFAPMYHVRTSHYHVTHARPKAQYP